MIWSSCGCLFTHRDKVHSDAIDTVSMVDDGFAVVIVGFGECGHCCRLGVCSVCFTVLRRGLIYSIRQILPLERGYVVSVVVMIYIYI